MGKVVSILDDGAFIQKFLAFGEDLTPSIAYLPQEVVKDNPPSLVAVIKNDQWVLKLVKPRRLLETLKLLWGRSRISKELAGNRLLAAKGIVVPKVIQYGYGLFPVKPYRFVGYFIMENLEQQGCIRAQEAVRDKLVSQAAWKQFFDGFVRDLETMKNNKIVFSDLKLNNVYLDSEGNPVWIDTGVTQYHILKSHKFASKFNFSINRFLRIHKKDLTEQEILVVENLKLNS